MRLLLTLVMAAIVATLLALPVGGLLALLAYAVLGLPLEGFLTFGGALHILAGLAAWWLILLAAALAYAGFAMPARD